MTVTLKFTPSANIAKIVDTARQAYNTGRTRSEEYRRTQLLALLRLVDENVEALEKAIWTDLRKSKTEASLYENAIVKNEIYVALENLSAWMKPIKPAVDLLNKLDVNLIQYEPLGVVLIIGAWNYPVQLTLGPLVGAIASGNCVILKPSEVSTASAQLLADLIPKYLDKECFQVINGAVEETTALLRERFDHILYTGGGSVAKVIMRAAAEHLTPVTLELGGKSPTFVDKNADIRCAARRIAWGRFVNAGQTCIAPDYVLCHEAVQDRFVSEIKKAVEEYYGADPQKSPDYGRIVNVNHFHRILRMLTNSKTAKVEIGGTSDEKDRYIAPTVLTNVTMATPVMESEIFGPILPIVTVKSMDEAVKLVNARDKPLALYIFTEDKKVADKILSSTSAGGTCINDTLMHAVVDGLPFGGVGASGQGGYHGRFGFDTFSHKRAVVYKATGVAEALNTLRYPPYSAKKISWLGWLLFKTPTASTGRGGFRWSLLFALAVGVLAVAVASGRIVLPH